MKTIGKIAAAAALVAGLSWSGASMAAVICSGCEYLDVPSYLGSHDPTFNDGSTFENKLMPADPLGFTDTWVFNISPAGLAQIDASFVPTANISGFTATLWSATATSCTAVAAGSTTPGTCTGLALVSTVGTTSGTGSYQVSELVSVDGLYAWVISGTVKNVVATGTGNQYTGSLSTFTRTVPEPAGLALVGLALAGAGLATRRRKAA